MKIIGEMGRYVVPDFVKSRTRREAVLLFLIGCFSLTQIKIIGRLGISEFPMIAIAPFLFISRYNEYRRAGLTTLLWLDLIWLANALLADFVNESPFPFMMRGIAVPIVLFATVVCLYPLLQKNLDNLKWLLLGLAISSVISIFVFQRCGSGEVAATEGLAAGAKAAVGYKLFWVNQCITWLTLPITGWYLSAPSIYVYPALLFVAGFNLVSGGRSAFLVAFFSFILVLVGRKSIKGMKWIKKNWLIFFVVLGITGVFAKGAYKFAATAGYMGEAERAKYEHQTKNGSTILKLLMKGRGDFFVGIYAALHKPFLGHGSHAIDVYGYSAAFLAKYGSEEDFQNANWAFQHRTDEYGMFHDVSAHSHIITYWDWHGIGALVFWLYLAGLFGFTLLRYMHVYPPYYGYLAVALPSIFWDICFSPLGLRTQFCVLIVVCVLLRQVAKQQRRMM